jgi:hypothetical protein
MFVVPARTLIDAVSNWPVLVSFIWPPPRSAISTFFTEMTGISATPERSGAELQLLVYTAPTT